MADLRKALVVDDDPAVRSVLVDYLTGRGFEVVEVEDGYEGSLAAKEGTFDFITVDLMMPQGNGTMVIEMIRGLGIETPVVVITGFASEENVKAAMESGANKVMMKPIEFAELGAFIDECFPG